MIQTIANKGIRERGRGVRRGRGGLARAVARRRVGDSSLSVSPLTFGTMLFGEGNELQESHRLLSICVEHGVNTFDTAEM